MAKIRNPAPPFAAVDVFPQESGTTEVLVHFRMDPDIVLGERYSRVALALDASRSIKPMFGGRLTFATSPNYVQMIARKLIDLLADFSRSEEVTVFYWALGNAGDKTEVLGCFSKAEWKTVEINGPTHFPWGSGTRLLPAIRLICDDIAIGSDFTLGVIVTDGIIEDEQACKDYCLALAADLAKRTRGELKLVLLAVGEEVDECQLQRLDDMFEGTEYQDRVDIWTHAFVSSMRDESDILNALFAELAAENVILAPFAKAIDDRGNVIASWDDGLPKRVRFVLPKGCRKFTIQTPTGPATQDIAEGLSQEAPDARA